MCNVDPKSGYACQRGLLTSNSLTQCHSVLCKHDYVFRVESTLPPGGRPESLPAERRCARMIPCLHLLTAGPCRLVIWTCPDRRFSLWAKLGGGRKSTPPGPTNFLPAGNSDELQLPDHFPLLTSHNSQTHFAKRHRVFFSGHSHTVKLSHRPIPVFGGAGLACLCVICSR